MPTPLPDLTSWASEWSDVRVTVVGLGEVGFSLIDTLAELEATTTVVYSGPVGDRATIAGVLGVSTVEVSGEEDTVRAVQDSSPDLVILAPEWEPALEVEARLRRNPSSFS